MKKKLTGPILIIASSGEASDVRYATGFNPVDPVVFLQEGRRRFLVVPPLESGRAQKLDKDLRVLMPSQLDLTKKQRRDPHDWAWGLVKFLKLQRVNVSPTFPAGAFQRLIRSGIKVNIIDEPLFPDRRVKNKKEIEYITAAQTAAVDAMQNGINLIRKASINRKGFLVLKRRLLSVDDVRFEIQKTLLQHNCIDAMDTIVACGDDAADPHERGSGLLCSGETIVIDIFPQHKVTGYWGDITRTVVKGQASSRQKKMYLAVKQAQRKALAMIRPGVKGSTIHQAVSTLLDQRGFKTVMSEKLTEGFFHGTGHSLGLDIHESPSISTSEDKLRAGNVVTVEPGLYYKGLGGVRIEDTVLVTSKGAKMLVPCEKVFEVA